MPTVRKFDEEEVRKILKLPPPKMSFDEMVLDQKNKNSITMEEYSD